MKIIITTILQQQQQQQLNKKMNFEFFFKLQKFFLYLQIFYNYNYRGCNNEYFDGIFAVELLVVLLFDDDEIDID